MSNTTPDHIKWLRHHATKNALGMLTGQDARALATFAAALQLYSSGDSTAVMSAKLCMRFAALAMQPKCRQFAKRLIPWALDWSDEDRLWIELGFVNDFVEPMKHKECTFELNGRCICAEKNT